MARPSAKADRMLLVEADVPNPGALRAGLLPTRKSL